MQVFLKNVCLRLSCYACHFKGINRRSDITMADFWGINDVYPEINDHKGTSLIKKMYKKLRRKMKTLFG